MGGALALSIVVLLLIGALPVSAAPGSPRRDLRPAPAPQVDEDLSGAAYVEPLARGHKNPTLASSLVEVGQQASSAGRAAALSQARAAGLTVRDEQVRVEI